MALLTNQGDKKQIICIKYIPDENLSLISALSSPRIKNIAIQDSLELLIKQNQSLFLSML